MFGLVSRPDTEREVVDTTLKRAFNRSGGTLVENVEHPGIVMQHIRGKPADTAFARDFK